MQNIPFNISATKQGSQALIRITGSIGWDTNAELFRSQVDGLVAQGAEDVHIYINSPGGSCFDAAEIVNILTSSFTGRITGEGGAVVASAATFIAIHCHSFEMPENGLFMIHKPWGGTSGNSNDVESYLNLLKKIEYQYLSAYKAKASDTGELEKQWNNGDWWMTANEALDSGFITSVRAPILIDQQTTAMISACGCPQTKTPFSNHKTDNEMDLKVMAKALGLPENASEPEIDAAIAAGRKAQLDLDAMKAEKARADKQALAEKIKAEVKAAADEKRITADNISMWENALETNYETNSKLLASLLPVAKIPMKPSAGSRRGIASPATYAGKTFEQLQDEDPEALEALMAEDKDAFDAIYEDYIKRNKLNNDK